MKLYGNQTETSQVESEFQGAGDKVKVDYKKNSATVETNSLTIDSVDKAVAYSKIDLDVWQIDRHVIGFWTVTMKIDGTPVQKTNYNVRLWLKPKVTKPEEDAIKGLIEKLPAFVPTYGEKVGKEDGDLMLEISLNDIHFGLLAWNGDSANDYDIEIASDLFGKAVDKILNRVNPKQINKILFPLGNDFFHLNNPEAMTPKGNNRLDIDTRLPKIYEAGKMAVIKAILRCIEVADTEVIWIPGNHDPLTSYFLADTLKSYFRNCDRVLVDTSPLARKYRQYGKNLIGFTHGDEEKMDSLSLIMPTEVPDLWAKTIFREFHIGHFHKKKQLKYIAGDTHGGVVVKVVPSICGTDVWHFGKAFVSQYKTAMAFLWDKNEGLINELSVNFIRDEYKGK